MIGQKKKPQKTHFGGFENRRFPYDILLLRLMTLTYTYDRERQCLPQNAIKKDRFAETKLKCIWIFDRTMYNSTGIVLL